MKTQQPRRNRKTPVAQTAVRIFDLRRAPLVSEVRRQRSGVTVQFTANLPTSEYN